MKKVGFFKSIHFKFVLVYTLLFLLALQLIGVTFSDRLRDNSISTYQQSLINQSKIMAYNAGEAIREAKEENNNQSTVLNKLNDQLSEMDNQLKKSNDIKKVEVIDDSGKIVAADSRNSNQIGKHTSNSTIMPDVLSSTAPKPYLFKERDTGERVMAITTPIYVDSERFGILYLEGKMENIYSQLFTINKILATATVIALLVTAALGMFLARTITKPLAQMQRQAYAISRGNFTKKVETIDDDEIGQLANAFNDMTDRLHEANAIAEAERRKLRSVLAYMTDGVIATDRKGHVILMNNRAESLLGVYRHRISGISILSLLNIEEDYTIEDLYKLTDSIILDFSSIEKKMLLRANFSTTKKENGRINGIIAVIHDVTEQEQVEMERREFVANVSHELRTPLTTMKSYLEALQDGAVNDEKLARKFIDVTQMETERMIRLVNDLLQLSKLDAKDYSITTQRTDFIAFCNHIVDRFEMSKRQNIHFVRKLPKKPIYVDIDRDKMTQVIDNIYSNAMKYSPEGGSITLKVTQKGQYLKVCISDEGVGIPKENLSKVFIRFYRVDKARSRKLGGTGLGLAIAKEMIEAQGGEIWAESEWNKGTSILFTLPLDKGGDHRD
ncbi:cell wall metabolism sensor histidine kinase WalK [Terrilactibacillus sp. BCM23-1]|uniref:histidine kinase n=1 Tax=Terrilactibacillus tamarindi TaxID=2599694 RepID=A0A6N8CME8_9BACI|nr:cell wall metabolism sensor histidine kinase WalK [Terrilactibacillus tamarindi]MTT31081.1 cell wall metabolism sensor histidine kinase WalK [Terrilactibacillus tamarindi]